MPNYCYNILSHNALLKRIIDWLELEEGESTLYLLFFTPMMDLWYSASFFLLATLKYCSRK
mgnify:CR=1 FL=1